ncbi:MAG: hypothetical protein RJB14_194, partial [Pseudomonadota bacterium]
ALVAWTLVQRHGRSAPLPARA